MAKSPAASRRSTQASPKGRSAAGASAQERGSQDIPADAPGADPDALPDAEEIAARLLPVKQFFADARYKRIRISLKGLAQHPPQVVLLEGGTADERMAAAHYWMGLLNCLEMHPPVHQAESQPMLSLLPGALAEPPASPHSALTEPCLACAECVRMVTHLHRDCVFLDGLAGSIKIDDVRGIRSLLGEPPREARYRMVVLREAQAIMEAAANALLKSLEEPNPETSFLLLTPQRERLLPTLVSRSMCLTLPWPDSRNGQEDAELVPWEAALCTFLHNGRGWFERTGVKGALDAPKAHAILNLCRRSLAGRLEALQSGAAPAEGLEQQLARLPVQRLRMVDEVLAECQDSLIYNVNPVLVMEWFATRLFLLVPR